MNSALARRYSSSELLGVFYLLKQVALSFVGTSCRMIKIFLQNVLVLVYSSLRHGITQCYLPPGRGDISASTIAKLVVDLASPEGCNADLTLLADYIMR